MTLVVEAAGVLNGNGHVRAKPFEQPKMRGRECVKFTMRRGEDSDQFVIDMEGDGDFRLDVGLAGPVIRIARYIGRITSLARGSDVSHHTFRADFQAMSHPMHRAAAHAGENKIVIRRVVQINIDFDTSQRGGDFVGYALDDFVEVETGIDTLGEFLEAHELRDLDTGSVE